MITQFDDSQTVLDYSKANGVGRLGIWSLGRDFGTCAKQVEAQPNCSGIAQDDYQFTRQLSAFTGRRRLDRHSRPEDEPHPPRPSRLQAAVGLGGRGERQLFDPPRSHAADEEVVDAGGRGGESDVRALSMTKPTMRPSRR